MVPEEMVPVTAGEPEHGEGLRPEIARSWRRVRMHRLDPDVPALPAPVEVDSSGRLMSAAGPVLRGLASELHDECLCLMLVDRHCRLVYQWSGNNRLRAALEDRSVVVGSELAEWSAGTNGLGTPFETGQPIVVNSREHYLRALRQYSCYGNPIVHPLTGRVEGVLNITSRDAVASPLFAPLLARAAQDIQARMVEGGRAGDRRLFVAFQNALRYRSTPVAVVGGDVVLTSRSCLERLGSVSPSVLRSLRAGEAGWRSGTRLLDLGESGTMAVEVEPVDGAPDGMLVWVGERQGVTVPDSPTREVVVEQAVFIGGEPGTGRTTAAGDAAGAADAIATVDATDAVTGSERRWVARLCELADTHTGTLVVENVQLLSARACTVLLTCMSRREGRVVLTGEPEEELPVPVRRVVARCPQRFELSPLRDRLPELPSLVVELGRRLGVSRTLSLSGEVVEALSAYAWPGNLTELAQLVRELAERSVPDLVRVADLPARFRTRAGLRGLGGLDLAERAAIEAALRACGGNKSSAAVRLGISRPTLYRRLRTLKISEPS